MILDKTINIKITPKTIKYYKYIGYECNINDNIDILISDIQKGSHLLINTKCDICGNETISRIYNYYKNINKYNLYCCSNKCSNIKRKNTNKNKYGVENVFQNENIKNKIKETYYNKYGVCHPMKNKNIKQQVKDTTLKNNGVDCLLKLDVIKKKGMFKKYGIEHPMQSLEIRNKIKEKYYNNHGVCHPMKSQIIKNKLMSTLINKYGYDNIFKIPDIKNKIKLKNKLNIKDNRYYMNYSKNVRNLTSRNIRRYNFLENWNGFDFYDNEYIKNNFKLNKYDNSYPNIDHKVSIKFGYDNNIPYHKIADINNLCITKRINNLKKGRKNKK